MGLSMRKILAVVVTASCIDLSACLQGKTTRYWDCCKPWCANPDKAQTRGIVGVCDIHDEPLRDPKNPNPQSACEGGGPAFACSSQTPFPINDQLAYGFTAVNPAKAKCCECFKLKFLDPALEGKTMIVQATNIGQDVTDTQFDLAIPGGGFGLFDACTKEWQATSDIWGEQYGGMSTNKCAQLPEKLQPGCNFRFDWMKGVHNPDVEYESAECPAELVQKSGCGIVGGPPTPGGSLNGTISSSSSSSSSSWPGPSSSASVFVA